MSLEMDRVDLSLVLPCYNSAHFLAESAACVRQALRRSGLSYEIIFVDDASRDNTVGVIEQLLAGEDDARSLFHPRNTGRGRAVMDGMRLARGRVVGFADVDLATPAHYFPLLAHAIFDGADVATALRVYKLSLPILHRWFLSRGYNRLVRKVLGQSFYDSETGCKFFSWEALQPLLAETGNSGWFWDTEIMVRATCHGYRIEEVPTVFVRRPELGSTVHLLRDTVDYFVQLLKFRPVVARLRAEHAQRECSRQLAKG
ncbi:MAG: glycosyltransferase [Chloroflexota bacterium]